ncbi:MAG: hypothetical protein ACI8RZ_005639 [Myxococcota bacterium]|jgi:uncharacterized protein YabN with tetrapyrrole methylase and pyrophosphatase domain
MGSLTIVGLGPARPEHLTAEAIAALSQAPPHARAYGLAHARQIAASVAPQLEVRSLDYLYNLPGVDRPTLYRDLAAMLLRRAFEDDIDVLYLVAGSPLFINDAALLIRADGRPVRLIHGLSFVDLVLDQVLWTGHRGLQLYSAWNIGFDGIAINPTAPALLCQLGEFSQGSEALQTHGSTSMLAALRDRLLADYPPNHPVAILYSSGHPDYRSLSRATPLSDLADQEVPVYSNLWVPAFGGPAVESRLAP